MPGVYDRLEASLQAIPSELPHTPRAVLAISAHWETPHFAIQANPNPPMLYDYGGFPEETYHIQYPAPGSPELALRVQELLTAAGIGAALDYQRGYDHGVFAPFAVIYPDANIPIVQLSILRSYEPEKHIAAGRALAPLRGEGILIVGSGLSYHNIRSFGTAGAAASRDFDAWLTPAVCNSTGAERTAQLLGWDKAPAARQAHPREDHLIPLMVAVGAAENEPGTILYHEENFFGGITASSYRFG
jgi:aromatic ring-opening dioxygenase catalytic subunit (LigB family)